MVRTFEYSTGKEDALIQTQLVFENFPTSIFKIVEKINILFLKQKFEYQSQISIGKYISGSHHIKLYSPLL